MDRVGTVSVPRAEHGDALQEHLQKDEDFIATKVFPVFKTLKKAATYPAITRASMTARGDTKRSTGGNYNRGGVATRDKSYACKERGFEVPLGADERALYASDFAAEMVVVKRAARVVMMEQEINVADLCLNTTTFTGSALYTDYSSAPWDAVGSPAIAQVKAVKKKILTNCGMFPNAMVMGYENFDRLTSLTEVKEAIKYTAVLTDEEIRSRLAGLFGIKHLIVGKGVYNSSKKLDGYSGIDIWNDDYVLVAVIADDPQDLAQPSVGRTFLWTEDCPENCLVESYPEAQTRSEVFRARQHTDEQIIDPFFGHLIKVDA